MKHKARRFVVDIPLFKMQILVQKGGRLQTMIDRYTRLIGIPTIKVNESSRRRGHFFKAASGVGAIWLHERSSAGALAHEVYHAAFWLLRDRGVRPSASTEEVFAYFHQHLVEAINAKLAEVK